MTLVCDEGRLGLRGPGTGGGEVEGVRSMYTCSISQYGVGPGRPGLAGLGGDRKDCAVGAMVYEGVSDVMPQYDCGWDVR